MSATTSSGTGTGGAARGFVVAASICGLFGLLSWAFDLWLFRVAPVQDWMVFYEAARAFLDGNLPLIFNGEALTAAINHRFATWLGAPLGLHPWVYPPPFLLLILPFGLLPPLLSVASFLAVGFAAALAVTRRCIGAGARGWAAIGSLLLCPAVPFNVLTGQNAFYTAALLVAAFSMLARRPMLAGALVGLLSVKPQLALMAWIALLAARQWRALGAAAAMAALLALASVAMAGLGIWRAWSALVLGADGLYRSWIEVGRLNGISVYACASWLGLPAALASAAQAAVTVAAGALTYWVYRRDAPESLRLAALLAATVLAAPHASNSDAVLLGLAASVFITSIRTTRVRPYQLAVAAAVWISPLFNPPVLFRIGCVTPLLVVGLLAMIAVAIRRGSREAGIAAAVLRPREARLGTVTHDATHG